MASQPPPEPAPAEAGLESMEGLVLDTVISRAGARPAAALACASTRLRTAVADDSLWRRFCGEDLGLDAPVDPEGRPLPSFQVAYKVWSESFGMYPLPMVKRVRQFWTSMKTWLSENFPEAYKTLCEGVSEAQLKSAEDDLGFKLPMPTKLLYRFCNAQLPFSEDHDTNKSISTYGLIGGYAFYDHWVNVHLSPLEQIVEETKDFYREFPDVFHGRKFIVVATSWFHPKTFLLDCSNGELYVGTYNLPIGGMLPCVPKALIKPAGNDLAQDGLLLWLEEHLRRLQSGMIKTRMLMASRYISLYPEAPPSCSSAVTNGIKVTIPMDDFLSLGLTYLIPIGNVPDQHISCSILYCYLVRMSLSTRVARHCPKYQDLWRALFRLCRASLTVCHLLVLLLFARLSRPEGKPFEVMVAPFPLDVPEYIF
ncbi:F-box protein SKIP16 [Zea mays]|uniref:F-box protein SKIP16 n=1 Tax=Zea mays TaxID=4577 RepID=A0A1D6PS72_MAIZE|nr:F-box protein SKIP16 [Zea mays]